MNIDQILRDLGLQDKSNLLRAKKVTSSTFREMDGSAKQIIQMSESLGLTAEEVVKIKAAIEEKTMMAVETVVGSSSGENHHHHGNSGMQQHMKGGYGSHHGGQQIGGGVPFSSRQVPNSRPKEAKGMQWSSGQMVFGQKGGLMKQEKVILDYGRKNRLSKLVQGGQGLVQPSQNLARKSTHQLSMSMNQFLNQHGQQQQPKLRNSSTVQQQPNQIRSSKYGGEQGAAAAGGEMRQSSRSRSPELGGGFPPSSHQQTLKTPSDSYSHTPNQVSVVGGAGSMAANQKSVGQVVHRQASVNSDSNAANSSRPPQQQAKPSSSQYHAGSQMQTASFGGASYPNQISSSGPPSSTMQNQQQYPRKMSGVMQQAPSTGLEQDNVKRAAPAVNNLMHVNNQIVAANEGRVADNMNHQQSLKIQESNSSEMHSRIKPESHHQLPTNIREQNLLRKESQQNQQDQQQYSTEANNIDQPNSREQPQLAAQHHQKRPAPATIDYFNNSGDLGSTAHVQQPQYQDLGNRQSQEYLSEKLDKLCSQQEVETNNRGPPPATATTGKPQTSQANQQKNNQQPQPQYSESQDDIDEDQLLGQENDLNNDLDESRPSADHLLLATGNGNQQLGTKQPMQVQQHEFLESNAYGGAGQQITQSDYEGQQKGGADMSRGQQFVGQQMQQKVNNTRMCDAPPTLNAVNKLPERQFAVQQEEESPSVSDLDDPDGPEGHYEEECDGDNQDDSGVQGAVVQAGSKEQNHYAGDGGSGAYHHRQEEQVDQSEDGPLGADDESDSKLSDLQQLPGQASTTNGGNHAAAPPLQPTAAPPPVQQQMQHHSRPTIGMKQPAQHYLPRLEMASAPDDAGSIPSQSSSPKGMPPAMLQPLVCAQENQQMYTAAQQKMSLLHQHQHQLHQKQPYPAADDDNEMSDSQLDDCDEDSEFLNKASPHVIGAGNANANAGAANNNEMMQHQQQVSGHAEEQVGKKVEDSDKGAEMLDEGEDDDKSMEDNYDDEQMLEDTDYNRRVQLLQEQRQRSGQHMWGARAAANVSEQLSASALNNAHQIASRNSINEQASKQQEVVNPPIDDSSEVSSELSDHNDLQQHQMIEKDNNERGSQPRLYHQQPAPQQQQYASASQLPPPQQPQRQPSQQYTQQQSQMSAQEQQQSKIQKCSQQSTTMQQQFSQNVVQAGGNHHQQQYGKGQQQQQVPADEPFVMATSNNHCSHSSQNTFLDVAGGGETGGQVSKHSSLAHSLHRQQLQNSQQASLKQQQQNQPASATHHQQIFSQSSTINKENQRQATANQNASAAGTGNVINGNQCTISQQSSFQSNIREPHHLLIENDERSVAVNHPHGGQQAQSSAHIQSHAPPQVQPNNQEMFEQLHNQLKVQSQNSNFNLNLTQVQAQIHNSGSSNDVMINQRLPQQTNSAFTPPMYKKQDNASYLQPEQQQLHSSREEILRRNSRVNSSQMQNLGATTPLSPTLHGSLNQKAPQQQQSILQRGLQAQGAPGSRNASASPHSPKQLAQSHARASSNSPITTLKVNKEVSAQQDLMEIMLQEVRQKAIESTTAEVTERVSREVRIRVTDDVTRHLTPEVTQRVRSETEQELNRKHQDQMQELKDQYEQSAQLQQRREEKLNHQIGKLEGQVIDASKQLEEKREEQSRLKEHVSELQNNIASLNNQIARKSEELRAAMAEKESTQQEHSATVQRLVGETQAARSDRVELEMEAKRLTQALDDGKKEVSRLQSDLASKSDALATEQQRLAAREAELQQMQSNLIEKEDKMAKLSDQLEETRAQCLQAQQERQASEERLRAECQENQHKLEEMKRERAQGELEKAQLQKQLEEAQMQRQRALDREAALIKKQRAQSEMPSRQVLQNTAAAVPTQAPAPRSLTPTTGQTYSNKQAQPCTAFPSSAPSDKQGPTRTTITAAMVTPPQAFKVQQDNSASMSASLEQSQKELQLKQERLQQLIQLQLKQDELIKLEQALKQSKQKVPGASPNPQKAQAQEQIGSAQAPLKPPYNGQIDDVDQQPTPKTPQTLVGNDLLIQRAEVGGAKLHAQALSQQADNATALGGDRINSVGTPQQPRGKSASFAHSVDYIDDEQDDQVDQEQDGDQDLMMYNSGSKNKMHNVKEESSYLPDCVPPEKNEKKKVVKKVRFHDDEQLIDSPYKSSSRVTHNQSQSSSGNAQATGATSLTCNAQMGAAVGKKRLRQEAAELNGGEHIILSQEILSGSLGHDGSSQQMDRYEEVDQEIEMIEEIAAGSRKPQDAVLREHVARGHLPTTDDEAGYKRQRIAAGDEQQQQHLREGQQIREIVNTSQMDLDENNDAPVRTSGPRLRRKVFQEDNANASASGDDYAAAEGNGRQQRKRRKAGQGRGVHGGMVGAGARSASPVPDAQPHGVGPQQMQQQTGRTQQSHGFHGGPQNLSGQHQRASGKGRVHQGTVQAAHSNSLEQKMKQQVNSIDQQYLKKNPNLLNMIQRIARK